MKIISPVLIIGAGYAGLILQHKLISDKIAKSTIIERGYTHGYTGDDYVIFTKKKFDFTDSEIKVNVTKTSSGSKDFDSEYTFKVYNKKKTVEIFSGNDQSESITGYKISSEILLSDKNIYGNIAISRIDIENKIAYGKVLHIGKDVECYYDMLVSTIPLHQLAKLINRNLFIDFNIFISYFPIGIKRLPMADTQDNMNIEYISDPNIPFYRKQSYKNTIY